MLQTFREAVKRVPVVGPFLHHAYLVAVYQEGKVETIQGGVLRGMRFQRFMRTFSESYVRGDYEPELQHAMESCLKPGQVVYDVGSNVGFMTLVAAKLVGPTGTVIAFEPSRATARQLQAQVEANGLTNVVIERCAVADRVGTAHFSTDTVSVMAHLVADAPGRTEVVPTTTLDRMSEEHPAPDLLKIDIEGAEILALRGASRLLDEGRPIILIELHSEDLYREFHAVMREHRYEVFLPEGGLAEPGHYERFVVARPGSN